MSEEAIHLSTREGYDLWSQVYDGDGNPLVALEERIVLPMLRDLRGRRVLDVGCGTGRHAIRLAQAGADVTAIDFSSGMMGIAKSKPGAERVAWIEHDLTRPLPVPEHGFDLVLCALVLDHIHDVPCFFGLLAWACTPSGAVLVTVMHPAMMLRGVQARFTDPATGQRTMPESAPNQISDYVMGAAGAGLRITHLSEHVVDEELIAACPRAEKHRDWPLLLVMRADVGT